ncbi:MAG: hypothetical protein HQ481_11010 [Alphaproteobacteria bacterium]|nr:hypothetical protein [Alphaproteobacteria bacterium]
MAPVRHHFLNLGMALGLLLADATPISALEVRKTGGPAALVLALGIAGPYARGHRPCGHARLPDGDGAWSMTPTDYGCLGYDTFVVMVRGAPPPNKPTTTIVSWCEAVVMEHGTLMLTEGASPDAAMICALPSIETLH